MSNSLCSAQDFGNKSNSLTLTILVAGFHNPDNPNIKGSGQTKSIIVITTWDLLLFVPKHEQINTWAHYLPPHQIICAFAYKYTKMCVYAFMYVGYIAIYMYAYAFIILIGHLQILQLSFVFRSLALLILLANHYANLYHVKMMHSIEIYHITLCWRTC